jgi:hypothetical protein
MDTRKGDSMEEAGLGGKSGMSLQWTLIKTGQKRGNPLMKVNTVKIRIKDQDWKSKTTRLTVMKLMNEM